MEIQPPKDWSTSRDGGPRRIIREDLRLADEDHQSRAEETPMSEGMSTNGYKAGSNLGDASCAPGTLPSPASSGRPSPPTPRSSARKPAAEGLPAMPSTSPTTRPPSCACRSIGAGTILALQEGLEPIIQMTCRDRNRLAMQADLLGAYALGMRNVLCLTGDHQSFGNHPTAKNVHDIDSMQLISMVKEMRDEQLLPVR